MYQCCACGRLFDEPLRWRESRGEHFGRPCYERQSGCPRCGGGYRECREEKITEEYYMEGGHADDRV